MKLNKAELTTPDSYSLLSMSPVGCQLSALKKAEDRDEIILRLFNPSDSQCSEAAVSFSRDVITSAGKREWTKSRILSR